MLKLSLLLCYSPYCNKLCLKISAVYLTLIFYQIVIWDFRFRYNENNRVSIYQIQYHKERKYMKLPENLICNDLNFAVLYHDRKYYLCSCFLSIKKLLKRKRNYHHAQGHEITIVMMNKCSLKWFFTAI